MDEMPKSEIISMEKLEQDFEKVLQELESFTKAGVLHVVLHLDDVKQLLATAEQLSDQMIQTTDNPTKRSDLLTQKRILVQSLDYVKLTGGALQYIKDIFK